eukprot:TRINITY_DN9088_c1_g1_i3.p1 TRINITY_DN9088_c1_g1~~TRINITY_DN9088_c1_g1_i3.p1  ORF type:complete len:1246 (+),score=343.19 TRINITY_DN9088_c1_g1_i3:498-3740(+)
MDEAELPFLKGMEVLPLSESTEALAASTKAVQSLESAIAETRNFIAGKSLELKKEFSPDKAKPVLQELAKFTGQINSASTRLGQFKKDTEVRRKKQEVQEVVEKIQDAETEIADLAIEAAPLGDAEKAPTEAKEACAACERVGASVKAASAKLEEATRLLVSRTQAVKASTEGSKTYNNLQSKLSSARSSVANSKKLVDALDQKFIAQRILAEVTELTKDLDKEVEKTTKVFAPLIDGQSAEFLVKSSKVRLATALNDHMLKNDLDISAIFLDAAGAGKDKISKEAFLSYLTKLPEAIKHPEIEFTDARKVEIFSQLDSIGGSELRLEDFQDVFKQHFRVQSAISLTDVVEVSESTTQKKLALNEYLEAQGPILKDKAGAERIQVKTLDGQSGFVTLKGNAGTKYLMPVSAFDKFCFEQEKLLAGSIASLRKTLATVNTKINQIGPSSSEEIRAELAKMRPKVQGEVSALETLKTKVVRAKKDFLNKETAEKNAHIEAAARKETEAVTGGVTSEVDAIEALGKKLEEAAEPLTSLSVEDVENYATPATLRAQVQKLQSEIRENTKKAKVNIQAAQGKILKEVSASMMMAKAVLSRLLKQLDGISKQCDSKALTVRNIIKSMEDKAYAQAAATLRSELLTKNLTAQKLVDDLCAGGGDFVSEDSFVKKLAGSSLPVEHAKLAFQRLGGGGETLSKRNFLNFVQLYYVVTKSIAITTDFEISKAKTLRKAELQEIIEVLEGPRTDEKLAVTRIRGRSLVDSVEGWVTLKGNQGTPYLQERKKPFYTVAGTQDVPLQAGDEGSTVRSLKFGEVLEVIEGPRKQHFGSGLRGRGKAESDGATGWFTIRDRSGKTAAESSSKIWTCSQSVAMTDELDIKASKVLKKLVAGDILTVEEGPVDEPVNGISRIRGRTSDDKTGWVTVKGNAGTVFAKPSDTHFVVSKEQPLQKAMSSNSVEAVRKLEVGETILLLEGPKEESFKEETLLKVKANSDGAVGWVSLQGAGASVKPWSGDYKCLVATPLQSQCKAEDAVEVRQVAVQEVLELLDGPVKEGDELRMRARAKKDGVTGWISIIDASGKRRLAC